MVLLKRIGSDDSRRPHCPRRKTYPWSWSQFWNSALSHPVLLVLHNVNKFCLCTTMWTSPHPNRYFHRAAPSYGLSDKQAINPPVTQEGKWPIMGQRQYFHYQTNLWRHQLDILRSPHFFTTGSQDQDRIKHNNRSERCRHKEIGSTLQILSLITQLRPPSPKRCGYEKWSQVTFPCNQQRRLAKLRRKTILYLFATNVFSSKTLSLYGGIDDGISSALFNRTCCYDTKEIGARRAGGGLGWGGISFRPI